MYLLNHFTNHCFPLYEERECRILETPALLPNENLENALPKPSFVLGSCDHPFAGGHQMKPGVSVFPSKWSKSEAMKAQDRAFKILKNFSGGGSCVFMGILDGVSGVKGISKSDLLAEYLAQGLCQAIEESGSGNFHRILNRGYLKACMEASKNSLLFPPSFEMHPSKNSSSTLSLVQASCVAESTGPYQGKFAVRIFALGDSAVLVYRPKENKSSLTMGQYLGQIIMNSSGKMKQLCIPGQVHLYHSDYIQQEADFSFDHICEKVYQKNVEAVRKYQEHYLDSGDFIIAASDGLWDNLCRSEVTVVLKNLINEFPEEHATNSIPYAYIIAEIAKKLSGQPEGTVDDISVSVNRIGKLDVEIDSAIITKYQKFINEKSSFFSFVKKSIAGMPSRINEGKTDD